MNFLNPILLYGLAAAALPLVIHLLSQRRAKEVRFPSIELLERMKTDRMRRLRLKQILLIILRTLATIAIVLAFARPAVNSSFTANARTSAVIIIDGSASMRYVHNGEELYDAAVRSARDILGMLGDSDSAGIVIAAGEPVKIGPGLIRDKSDLSDALDGTDVPEGICDADAAFETAFDMLSDAIDPNREIYFITDGADNAMPDSVAIAGPGYRGYTVLVGPESRNGSVIEDFVLTDRLVTPDKPVIFSAEGVLGPEENEMTVEFIVDSERKARSTAKRTVSDRAFVEFEYTPEAPGLYSVTAVVDDGRFEPAETRRIVMRVPERANVLLAGDSPGDVYFLEKALDPDPERSMFDLVTVTDGRLSREHIAGADVVILSGIETVPREVYRSLVTSVVERGIGLVVFPPRVMDDALYADGIFRDMFPVTVEGRIEIDGSNTAPATIDRFNMSHPILRGISREGEFAKPSVRSFVRMRPAGVIDFIARFNDGALAAGEAVCGKGRVAMFATGATQDSGDLPLTGIFLPLFIRTVQYLSGTEITGNSYEVGDTLNERIGSVPEGETVYIKAEEGSPRSVEYVRGDGGAEIAGVVAGETGFYSVFVGNNEVARYSVDIPRSEILFRRAGSDMAARAFKGIQWKTFEASSGLAEQVADDRFGTELFGLFIVAALALLAAEMAIARKA